jgi:hypothetical protein
MQFTEEEVEAFIKSVQSPTLFITSDKGWPLMKVVERKKCFQEVITFCVGTYSVAVLMEPYVFFISVGAAKACTSARITSSTSGPF